MANEPENSELRYQYKWRSFPFIWLPLMSALIGGLVTAAFLRYTWQDALAILAIGMVFELFATWFLLQALADVCISDRGIARRVRHWTWQTLRWSDVTRLTVMPSTDLDTRRKVRSFSLRGSKAAPLFSRLVIFQERPGEMDELLAKLDTCVAKHHIPVRKL